MANRDIIKHWQEMAKDSNSGSVLALGQVMLTDDDCRIDSVETGSYYVIRHFNRPITYSVGGVQGMVPLTAEQAARFDEALGIILILNVELDAKLFSLRGRPTEGSA